MGKNLKGKEVGKYIHQLPNKKYQVLMPDALGKRQKKLFDNVYDAQKFVADMEYFKDHSTILAGPNTTVDAFFDFWVNEVKAPTVRPNTVRNYKERYEQNIKEYIGKMLISEVRANHCQTILNQMMNEYKTSTIAQVSHTLYGFLEYAEANDCIDKNPMRAVKVPNGLPSKPPRVLTREEQKKFLEAVKGCSNYNQYALILQTGLRTGELIGLQWGDINFEKQEMCIQRSLEFRYSAGEWRVGPPKSKSGYRVIPLTDEAIEILKDQKEKMDAMPYISPKFKDYVFICRKGTPTKNSAYDTKLQYYCDKIGMQRFSMHALRHTFATRCIEAGMSPKALQQILGHSSWNITMNRYVHAQSELVHSEMTRIDDYLKL